MRRAFRRQVLRQRLPLATGREHGEDCVEGNDMKKAAKKTVSKKRKRPERVKTYMNEMKEKMEKKSGRSPAGLGSGQPKVTGHRAQHRQAARVVAAYVTLDSAKLEPLSRRPCCVRRSAHCLRRAMPTPSG